MHALSECHIGQVYQQLTDKFRYGFPQPTASPSQAWLPPRFASPNNSIDLTTSTLSKPTLSICRSHGYPSQWDHGGDAYVYWHGRQPQQQLSAPPCLPPAPTSTPPPPQESQPQYTSAGHYDRWPAQQRYSRYEQQLVPTRSSYLSPSGVHFDLPRSAVQGQGFQHLSSTYPASLTDRHTIPQNLREASAMSKRQSATEPLYGRQSSTIETPSTCVYLHDAATMINDKPSNALVRYSPESSKPRARPYQGRREDKFLKWDKQYGYGFAVSKSEPESARYPAADRGESSDYPVHPRLNFSPVSPCRNRQTPHPLHWKSVVRAVQTNRTLRPSLAEASFNMRKPAPNTVQARRTHRPTRVYGPQTQLQPMQLLEHSVDPHGALQTDTQEVRAKAVITTHRLKLSYLRTNEWQEPSKDALASRKLEVPLEHLKRLINDCPVSADKQCAFDAAHKQDDKLPAETNSVNAHLGDGSLPTDPIYSSHSWPGSLLEQRLDIQEV